MADRLLNEARIGDKPITYPLDEFAHEIANGLSPNEASLKVYGTRIRGNPQMQRLRQKLGPQAR